jgi:hypothetical protein
MANTANPRGFELIGSPLSLNYYIKTTSAAIYPGEAVVMASDGKVIRVAAGGLEAVGVAQSYAAAATTTVLVADSPLQEYYIQDDGVSGTLAVTSIGLNADIVATAANTTFLKAKMSLDTNTAVTSTFQLRILGFHPDDEVGKYIRCRVRFNEHHQSDLVGI